jgi:biopolymer transport protein ExbB
MTLGPLFDLLERGGVAIWVIAALSVLALAVALWKLSTFLRQGVWSQGYKPDLDRWVETGAGAGPASRGPVAQVAAVAIAARENPALSDDQAREETERVAKALLAEARSGLRILDLTVTIAPLLGLFGTVLGMIDAFQALQTEGAAADAATLAGGIWEALLTTAAGMAVAIPASIALAWFDSVIDGLQARMEDAATRVFTAPGRR